MDNLLVEYNRKSGRDDKSHYQDARAISLLLGFKYPSLHSLFKHGVLKKFCQEFDLKSPKTGQVANQILTNNSINQQVKSILIKDQELLELHKNRLTPESYREDDNNILTQDFIYSIFAYDTIEPKYWLYSPGKNAEEWDHFYSKGIMALGWGELGDLSNYESKEDVVRALQDLYNTDSSKKNDATATFNFMSEINIGDIVFAKKGTSKLLGYGIIASDYEFDATAQEFKHIRKVNWKKKGIWNAGHNLAIKTLTDISNEPSPDSEYNTYHERLMAIINGNEVSSPKSYTMSYPINTILYGPPGTGKTYNTKNIALKILGYDTENLSREKIKEEYDLKVDEGQIVFTTFHQSMSYEDFIEGIKPETTEGEKLSYPVKAGIFKTICAKAEDSYLDSIKGISEELPFDEAFEKLKEEWEENERIKFSMKSEGYEFTILGFTERSIQFRKSSGGTGHTLSISTLRDYYYYGTRQITNVGIGKYYPGVLEKLKSNKPINNSSGKKLKNYILIIDEINRGNVSAIFGELITLLEPDKRLGESEQITLELPYSKGDSFGVPPNLYIIGTMNTADRSVEALDSALRRRFSFTEMPPEPRYIKEFGKSNDGVIDGINLVTLLKTINKRIEKLLDKDHAIGHSYFLKIKSLKQLKAVFANKVIPLLQEYFFGDYGKIGLVLGSGFVSSIQGDTDESFFATFEDYEIGSLLERKVYRIEDSLNMKDEEFKQALLHLLR